MGGVQTRTAEFERLFFEALCDAGVQAISNFRIKSKDRLYMVDTYISSPQRAIVEIKLSSGNISSRLVENGKRQLVAAREAFGKQVICFLVVVNEQASPSRFLSSDKWLEIIEVSGNEAATNAAAQIRDHLYASIPAERLHMLSPAVLMDAVPEVGSLSDVLVNFRTRITPDAFEILRSEAANFYREYSSGHYTTSALCVGRMLEFIIYTLAKAWSVPINKRSIALLDDLDQKFKYLSNRIIEYAFEEPGEQKDVLWKNLSTEMVNFTGTMTTAAMSLNDNHEKIYSDYPINIEAILRGIKRRYRKIKTVRDEIDLLFNSGIREVMDMRNRAAHANTSGNRTDYEQSHIDQMIDNLRSVLFSLGNIADAIDRELLNSSEG